MALDGRGEADAVTRAMQNRLRELLRGGVAEVALPLRQDVQVALAAKGKLLAPPATGSRPAGVWALLTSLVAQYIAPASDLQEACQAALAVECQICAFDILDDVEDADATPTLAALGTGRALNTATALLVLAHRFLCPTHPRTAPLLAGMPAEADNLRKLRLLNALIEGSMVACEGQHEDLVAESQPLELFGLEHGVAIATAKAGSLMRMACVLGALSVDAPADICALVAELGQALGVAHQLDNDAHDLENELQQSSSARGPAFPPPAFKTDLLRGKKTLPVILAAQQRATLQKTSPPADVEWKELLQDGITATWSLCLLYRTRVRTCSQQLETTLQRPLPPALRHIIGVEA